MGSKTQIVLAECRHWLKVLNFLKESTKKTLRGGIRTRVMWGNDFLPAPLPTELFSQFGKHWLLSHYIGFGSIIAFSTQFVLHKQWRKLYYDDFCLCNSANCNCPKAHKQTTLISIPFTKTNDEKKRWLTPSSSALSCSRSDLSQRTVIIGTHIIAAASVRPSVCMLLIFSSWPQSSRAGEATRNGFATHTHSRIRSNSHTGWRKKDAELITTSSLENSFSDVETLKNSIWKGLKNSNFV